MTHAGRELSRGRKHFLITETDFLVSWCHFRCADRHFVRGQTVIFFVRWQVAIRVTQKVVRQLEMRSGGSQLISRGVSSFASA
jgi:hypothetical protein